MRVDVWSDVVCPWCYIGKRRIESAIERFDHDVELSWHSFELDPDAPATGASDYAGRLADKYGRTRAQAQQMLDSMTATAAQDGLDYHFEIAKGGNTFDAHRLLHFAAERGRQHELEERVFRATFTEGAAVADHETLAGLAAEVGLDRDDAEKVLATGEYAEHVRADERTAQRLGITGVPFFVVDEKYGVSGAQPADVLLQVLDQAWAERSPLTVIPTAGGEACEGDSCAV